MWFPIQGRRGILQMKSPREISNCHDCDAKPGQPHNGGCDVERCSVCGGQRIQCVCKGHDPLFARWTGIWPGAAECAILGLYAKFPGKNGGWEKCDVNDPEGMIDLNTFYTKGYHEIFFVKPK